MWEAMCRVETYERERAFLFVRAKLIPARLLFGCRYKSNYQPFQSFFIDAISQCARRANLVIIARDLSVVRRDVVRAGLGGSQRAHCNFRTVE